MYIIKNKNTVIHTDKELKLFKYLYTVHGEVYRDVPGGYINWEMNIRYLLTQRLNHLKNIK